MCGISGLIERRGIRVEKEILRKLAAPLANRGPDAEGYWHKDNVGFAHRRLSVIDLSESANQPFVGVSGDVVLAFNGEIYNYRELKEALRAEGRIFRTNSDTEVILEAYLTWGFETMIAKLDGMFAFAIYDGRFENRPKVILARDRFGIKPLFYSCSGGRMAFSSLASSFSALDWVSKEVEPQTAFYFLKFGHLPCPLSIYSGVRQLEPGHWLAFEDGAARTGTYYSPLGQTSAATVAEERSEDEWLDELDATLKNVVKRQINGDVPVGCFLSGGIDSSLLALTFAEVSGRPFDTFTIRYRNHELDESVYARQVAERVSSRHHEIEVEPRDLIDLLPTLHEHFDQPFADPALLPSLILARQARKHVTVALSGDGGDEMFFGYSYQKALLRMRSLLFMPRAFRSAVVRSSWPARTLFGPARRHQMAKLADILEFNDEAEFFQYFIGTIGPFSMRRLASLFDSPIDLRKRPFGKMIGELEDVPWAEKIEQVFMRTFLPDTVLAKTDRTGMAFGLEGRVPFLDDEMVAFSKRLPFSFKYRNGQSKYLLRKLLTRKLYSHGAGAFANRGGRLADRRKQGFSVPIKDWFRGELTSTLRETLSAQRLAQHKIFNFHAVERLIDEHVEGRANHSHVLFSLLSFQLWQEGQGGCG